MAVSFRLDEVPGTLELKLASILKPAWLKLDGQIVPQVAGGDWVLPTRDGGTMRIAARPYWHTERLVILCSLGERERVVDPGVPRWLAWVAAIPALFALPNLCAGPAGICGMVLPLSLYGVNRAIARQHGWPAAVRAGLIGTLVTAWIAMQVALVTWALGAHEERAAADHGPLAPVVDDGRSALAQQSLGFVLDEPIGLVAYEDPADASAASINWRWRDEGRTRVLLVRAVRFSGHTATERADAIETTQTQRLTELGRRGVTNIQNERSSDTELRTHWVEPSGAFSYARTLVYADGGSSVLVTIRGDTSAEHALDALVDSLRPMD